MREWVLKVEAKDRSPSRSKATPKTFGVSTKSRGFFVVLKAAQSLWVEDHVEYRRVIQGEVNVFIVQKLFTLVELRPSFTQKFGVVCKNPNAMLFPRDVTHLTCSLGNANMILEPQFNSIQFSFIYIAPNYNNCHLKALK